MDEHIAMLFGDDDFEDDDESEGFVVSPPSVYEVGGPSIAAAGGRVFPLPASRISVTRVQTRTPCKEGDPSAGDGVPDGLCRGQIRAGAGFTTSSAAERFVDSATADYGFGDELS
nr:hypothetical protein [Tanacetum cinerariifolium]